MALAGICKTTQVLQFFKFSQNSVNFLIETQFKNVQNLFFINNGYCKYFCMDKKSGTPGKPGDPKTLEQAKKKKGITSPQITLISSNDEVSTMSLEQAEKLSKRRDLKLVKIVDFDTKTEKPVYKLMTALEFFQEDFKMKEKKRKQKQMSVKESKLFTISSKIGDNDLESKIRYMFKLLKKKHEVRVFIACDGNPIRAEEICKFIKEELSDVSGSSNHISKGNILRLSIQPKQKTTVAACEADATDNNKPETTQAIIK
ncbi:uncharacterized protein LOC131663147 [Phymastichus coffea]|uniref:uncharacterized protein LOC131663147 n=1 Tax=Phymastichus coffea TaxID=108790 RepID=UPI00273C049B|nr:uncharacterized protein LOC131663147 [Phymastichus coffea]